MPCIQLSLLTFSHSLSLSPSLSLFPFSAESLRFNFLIFVRIHCQIGTAFVFSPPCRWSSHRVGGECCEATTACQHTSPLRHLWLILVTLRASSSQRHQRLPFQFRKASTQANKSKVKNTTLTHREHNSRHQGPQAGSFWRQLLIFTGTPVADSFGANL